MKLKKTKIMNMYLIEPELFKDKRGIFRRNYCQKKLIKKTFFLKSNNATFRKILKKEL